MKVESWRQAAASHRTPKKTALAKYFCWRTASEGRSYKGKNKMR